MMQSLHRVLWGLLFWVAVLMSVCAYRNMSGSPDSFLLGMAIWLLVFIMVLGYLSLRLKAIEATATHLAQTNATQDWVKDGLAQLSTRLAQTEALEELLQTAISTLARYTDSGRGAIYLFDEAFEYYYLKAGYALEGRESAHTFNLGEGIVGQVGLEGKAILLQRLQDKHSIYTASIIAATINTYTFPLIYKDQRVGIVELGSSLPFDDTKQTYLQASVEILSAAIFASQKAADTGRLLEQTRHQAKELEVKADEVEKQNLELARQKEAVERQAREIELQNVELEQQRFETEKKANDLELARLELEQQNKALAVAQDELKLHAEELASSNKYKAEFLANMSHELRTPLNAINVLAGLLKKNPQGNLSAKQLEQLNVIHYSGSDLLQMINDLLDLSKIEAGQMSISIEALNPAQLGQELKSMFDPLIAEKPIDLCLEQDDAVAEIQSDKAKIRQIIKNFLSNALKFTEEGSITISIHASDDPKYAVCFSVQDTGIGIAQNKLEEIFESFRQADGSTARKYGGTGLGLSISRELATILGGQIRVESQEKSGSIFKLYLPEQIDITHLDQHLVEIIAPKQSSQTPYQSSILIASDDHKQAGTQEGYESPKTILLIDDDMIFASLLMAKLSKLGYRFLHANNGREGLLIAKEQQPDGILLDRKMPLIGGDETLRLLKRDAITRHIPVDILSADAPDIHLKRCGAVAVWQKPLDFEQLEQMIEGLLSVSRRTPEVVVIEDNQGMQDGIETLLKGCVSGIKLRMFSDASSALAHLDMICPTVVVIDLGLPNIEGLEMVDLVLKSCPNVPIIVYTSRDLTAAQIKQLREFTDTIILKASDSMLRLINEITLFLHRRIELVDDCKEKAKAFEPSGGSLLGKKVLLVDDDVRNLFSLSSVLDEVGIETTSANSAKEALRILQTPNNQTELILTDIMMPEMDGYELIKQLKDDPKTARLPIVALTARVGSDEKERCLAIGADDYLSKPIDEGLLMQILRFWLAK